MAGEVVRLAQQGEFTGRQIDLIKQTVASDTDDMEFNLFCEVAQRAGLDPFRKQISAIVFSKDDPGKRKMSIITTIDGLRAIAARSGRYRPDEEEAEYVYDPALKGPANPLGLVKATVTIHVADAMREGGWKPVKGWAYWDEYAPIREEAEGGFDWVDTGETWPDTGRPKKRKVPRVEGAVAVPTLDTSGNWGKMPRVMIAKCAEAQAIRKAFPEDTSGLYEGAELDRQRTADLTASETIQAFRIEDRLQRVGAANAIMLQLSPASPIEPIPLGQVADRVMEVAKDFDLRQMRWFKDANTHPLREYWARAKTDALELNKWLAKRLEELVAQDGAR